MMKIKKDDKVIVLAGKDKGKTGTVARVIRDQNKVIVEGINMRKKTVRATAGQPNNMVEFAAPIHISNVALIDAKTKKASRVGFQMEKGKKVRITRASGSVVK